MTLIVRPGYLAEGDPSFSNVSLLLHGDGTNGSTTITDSSPTPKTVTAVGNAQISTAQSKFGGASIAFDGTGDRLSIPLSNDYAFGASDFTVEYWAYYLNANAGTVWDGRALTLSGNALSDYLLNGRLIIYLVTGNTNLVTTAVGSITTSLWTHVAIARASSSLRVFLNGIQSGSTASDSTNITSTSLTIGGGTNSSAAFNGYIDDLRITKGVARYTANFTPPDAPFPDAQY